MARRFFVAEAVIFLALTVPRVDADEGSLPHWFSLTGATVGRLSWTQARVPVLPDENSLRATILTQLVDRFQ